MPTQPTTLAEYIDAIRAELVCDRCRKYVGSLDRVRYLPPLYPIAVGRLSGDENEAEALIGFEWQMVAMLRGGKFTIRHPERGGQCITYREWAARDAEDEDAQEEVSVASD